MRNNITIIKIIFIDFIIILSLPLIWLFYLNLVFYLNFILSYSLVILIIIEIFKKINILDTHPLSDFLEKYENLNNKKLFVLLLGIFLYFKLFVLKVILVYLIIAWYFMFLYIMKINKSLLFNENLIIETECVSYVGLKITWKNLLILMCKFPKIFAFVMIYQFLSSQGVNLKQIVKLIYFRCLGLSSLLLKTIFAIYDLLDESYIASHLKKKTPSPGYTFMFIIWFDTRKEQYPMPYLLW